MFPNLGNQSEPLGSAAGSQEVPLPQTGFCHQKNQTSNSFSRTKSVTYISIPFSHQIPAVKLPGLIRILQRWMLRLQELRSRSPRGWEGCRAASAN